MSLFSGSTSRMRLEELGGFPMFGWQGNLQALPSLRWRYLELSSHQISDIENIEKHIDANVVIHRTSGTLRTLAGSLMEPGSVGTESRWSESKA